MEEQLKQYLAEFVEMLKEGGQFALDQLPGFIHEYLTYYAWYHGFWMIFFLSIIVILIYAFIKFNQSQADSDGIWDSDAMGFSSFFGSILFIPSVVLFFINLFDFIKVTVAPRLYLIENLIELTK